MLTSGILTLLVGGYSSNITRLAFDPSARSLSVLGPFDSGLNPSWITTHPLNCSVLYAINELPEPSDGGVTSFIITDHANGVANKINNGSVLSFGPAHLAALTSARQVVASNYGGQTATFIPISKDFLGFDEAHAQKITFNATVSHPHQAVEVGDEVLIPDLGADKIWRLKQEPSPEPPTPNWQVHGFIEQPAGSGPRHIAVNNPSTLSSQTIPPLDSGIAPKTISTLSVLPPGANQSDFAAAELVLDKKRGLLYASNRGIASSPDPRGDSIAIFCFNRTGHLELKDQVSTGLHKIRALTHGGPDNRYIAAGGQVDGGIVVYEKVKKTLVERARMGNGTIEQPATFVWL
ncbi:hypothetical protein FRC07_001137 [Ceratobasidium sp. 392]|nr:hypothetical protein FRC07_001137 [Ceratobasidium sp. 392]